MCCVQSWSDSVMHAGARHRLLSTSWTLILLLDTSGDTGRSTSGAVGAFEQRAAEDKAAWEEGGFPSYLQSEVDDFCASWSDALQVRLESARVTVDLALVAALSDASHKCHFPTGAGRLWQACGSCDEREPGLAGHQVWASANAADLWH